ncbi:type I-E CRISPR-associated protein Cas6/Cse3/CasE [Actinomadura kijaniata]|uniref:type I-E CRISPR-associated protein Cas6/Cse3/CasE n=1 Tax=Actinomadura kijaniata TaxID=46161 RepID=UPI003F1966C4
MTYLSRIRINPLRAESRKMLANPRILHAAVMGGIADHPTQERVLWRLDADNPRRPMLFALTRSKPDWTHIVESAGWPDADGEHADVRDYTPLLAQLATGRQFAFRVTANPVQNTFRPHKPTPGQLKKQALGSHRAQRLGHRTAAAQLQWFTERTQRWGFGLPEARTDAGIPGLADDIETRPAHQVRITRRDRLTFNKSGNPKPVVLHTATFEGMLEITDVRVFTERLLTGIGPAKAYGCGLLTLAPPRTLR